MFWLTHDADSSRRRQPTVFWRGWGLCVSCMRRPGVALRRCGWVDVSECRSLGGACRYMTPPEWLGSSSWGAFVLCVCHWSALPSKSIPVSVHSTRKGSATLHGACVLCSRTVTEPMLIKGSIFRCLAHCKARFWPAQQGSVLGLAMGIGELEPRRRGTKFSHWCCNAP